MAFIDEITLHMKAGKGGDGYVGWRNEKGREFGGPAGGNGGRGGDVYVRGVRDYTILLKYRNIKDFAAKNGQNGMGGNVWGKNGQDLILDVPIGSVLTNETTGEKFEVLKEGELIFLLKGGKAGLGNAEFKGPKNVAPEQFTLGNEGERADFFLELQLVVDLGFVGFPNAGKSSLLNELTRAHAKVAAYQFTTLEPNLGDLHGYILADIPGLIEGASEGKGLGFKFLRHVNRTKAILHLVSLENENITEAYKTIRGELATYSKELSEKKEILLLTKTDLVTPAVLKKKIAEAKKLNKLVFTLSIIDDKSIKEFKDSLIKILRELEKESGVKKKSKKEEDEAVVFKTDTAPTKFLEERAERAAKKIKGKK
ncbi:MAG: GTPase ObgE [Candidatus Pacebacteria bacterium]|nr:GTPase ObgE [Candidatus Paceibacterota bacterium]MDD5356563.1 GTPase ObgE [Candidatus Paceibacterota bacterium]